MIPHSRTRILLMILLPASLLGYGCTPAPKYTGPHHAAEKPASRARKGPTGLTLQAPLRDLGRDRIGSPFGIRKHPSYGTREFHQGVDFEARMGEDVFAAAGGVVGFAGKRRRYGTVVILEHSDDVHTVYAHLSEAIVRTGERVEAGQIIGKVGTSGNATGAHLHFEVRIGGEAVDPLGYLILR